MAFGLIIRPARPDDRRAMERICAHTWEWGDYIPEVWDEWLADERSLILVGELGEQLVALSRVSFQTPDQVWLAGMRVDPEYRRRGIAGRFLDHSLAYARERGARVVRLGTSSRNTAVHALAARAGMERVGAFVLWKAASLHLSGSGTQSLLASSDDPFVLTLEQATQVEAFLRESEVLAHTHGLYSVDWTWEELTVERVAQFLQGGQVVAQVAPDGSIAALATVHLDPDEDWGWIGFVDGVAGAAVGKLAEAIRVHVGRLAVEGVNIMLPNLDWLLDAFHSAGYRSGDWEGELWIFESRRDQSLPGDGHDR